MSDRSFISVVIPTYNRTGQVQAALNSVLAQTYPVLEVIVVDDGSTDGTGEALQQLISQQGGKGKQIRYFFQPNQGQSAARNRGIAEARGEWIAFLDSDDVWLPEKLEWQVRAIEQFRNQCGACFTDVRFVNHPGLDTTGFQGVGRRYEQEIGINGEGVTNLSKSFGNYFVSTLLARADLVKQIAGFDPHIEFAEDHDFSFRLSLVTQICCVNKTLVEIDRGASPPGSTCRPWEKLEVRLRGQQYMFEKWLSLGSALPPDIRRTVVRDLRQLHSARANWYLETKRYAEARQAVSRAMRYEFTPKLAIKWALTQVAPTLARRISPKAKALYAVAGSPRADG
jgi:glycosyltransferase involved in cell wall biosynthesis